MRSGRWIDAGTLQRTVESETQSLESQADAATLIRGVKSAAPNPLPDNVRLNPPVTFPFGASIAVISLKYVYPVEVDPGCTPADTMTRDKKAHPAAT